MRKLALTLVPLLLLACGREPAAPGGTGSPVFTFTNGPDHPGQSVIFRFETSFLFGGVDPARGLFSINGLGNLDPAQSFFCGGADIDTLSFQEAFAAGVLSGKIIGQGVTQHVWDLTTLTDFCTDPPLAQGTGNIRLQDNDVIVSGSRANSFGYHAQGTLVNPQTGQRVHYEENQRAVIKRDGTFLGFLNEDIHLRTVGP